MYICSYSAGSWTKRQPVLSHNLLGEKSTRPITQPTWRKSKPSYHTSYLEKKQTVLSQYLLGKNQTVPSHNLLGGKSNRPITRPTWRMILELCYVIYLEKDEIVLLITQQTRRTMERPIIFENNQTILSHKLIWEGLAILWHSLTGEGSNLSIAQNQPGERSNRPTRISTLRRITLDTEPEVYIYRLCQARTGWGYLTPPAFYNRTFS